MSDQMEPREAMEFDVLVVGAGPGGLSAAIKLKQLNPELSVCVVEKGGEVGAHTLSGAVMEPRALLELFPECDPSLIPLATPVSEDRFMYLTKTKAFTSPVTPATMHNHGNYIVSLGNVVRWLGQQAEELGVEIYPGFAAAEVLFDGERVAGVATGDMGIGCLLYTSRQNRANQRRVVQPANHAVRLGIFPGGLQADDTLIHRHGAGRQRFGQYNFHIGRGSITGNRIGYSVPACCASGR